MKKVKIFIVLMFSVFFLANAFCANNLEKERFFVAGKAFSDGFYEASLSLFKKFVEDFPESSDVYTAKLYMAKCYYFKGDYPNAISMLGDLSSKKETGDIMDEVYYWLAEVHYKGKSFKDSLFYATKITEDYPSSKYIWQAHSLLGLDYLELSDIDNAEEHLEKIIEKCNDQELQETAYSSLLNFYFQNKNYSRIISLGEKYTKMYPKGKLIPNVYFYLGEAFYDRKDIEQAIRSYKRALETSSDTYLNDLIYQGLAFSFVSKEEYDTAKNNITQIKDEELRLYSEGVYCYKTGAHQRALEIFDKLLKDFAQSKNTTSIYLTKADTLYEMGRLNDSLSTYKYILDNFKGLQYAALLDKAHYGVAWCYLKKGEFRKAIEEFKNTLKYTNNSVVMVSSQIQIADAYQESGNYNQALDIYTDILRNNPNTVYTDYIQFQTGMIFLKTKRLEESFLALRNLQKNFPSSKLIPQGEYYLAVGYFSSDMYPEAKSLIEDFIKKFPQNELIARAHYLYGKCFFNEKNYQKAIEVFKGIIGKFSDKEIDELVYIDIGNAYLNLSDFEQAKKTWEEFLLKFSSSQYAGSVALYLGGLYEQEKNYEEAEKYYKKVLDNYKDSSVAEEATLSLGHLYWMKEDTQKAESYFKKLSLAESPLSLKSKLYLAKLYVQKGNNKDAVILYDELIASSSDIAKVAMLDKAFLLKDMGDYKEASNLFAKLIKDGVDSPKLRFNFGACLEKINKDKEAIEEYFRAVYLFSLAKDAKNDLDDTNDYAIKSYFRIAKVYEKENQIGAAVEVYKKIANSDTEESRIAKTRLEELGKDPKTE
ncbi:MAG: tetratricopeptide repeat protein [Candidatus Omnitrophota bacterium]